MENTGDNMEIERVEPTPEASELQKLFERNEKETIKCLIDETKELYDKLEAWEKCAENLVDYAHEFVANLSTWGKGYNRYDRDIEQAEDAIAEYNRLKNETKPND
jgi:hypothetical protein